MSAPTLTKLYNGLTVKLGKETAEDLTNYIDHKISATVDTKCQNLATKEDLLNLEIRLNEKFAQLDEKWNVRFIQSDEKWNARFDKSDEKWNARFDRSDERWNGRFDQLKDMGSDSHKNLMKWMFIFWVGQLIAIFSFLLLFLDK